MHAQMKHAYFVANIQDLIPTLSALTQTSQST